MARPFHAITKTLLEFFHSKPGSFRYYRGTPYSYFPFLNELNQLAGGNNNFHEIEQRRKISQAFWSLKRNRLVITRKKPDGSFEVELTEKGRRKIRDFQFEGLQIPTPKTWDHTWRIVIFDIPNKRNAGREALRNKIKELDFYQLQKSVWVFPYPCDTEIEFIVEFFKLYQYVQIIEATKIKNDAQLRKYYRLF